MILAYINQTRAIDGVLCLFMKNLKIYKRNCGARQALAKSEGVDPKSLANGVDLQPVLIIVLVSSQIVQLLSVYRNCALL